MLHLFFIIFKYFKYKMTFKIYLHVCYVLKYFIYFIYTNVCVCVSVCMCMYRKRKTKLF